MSAEEARQEAARTLIVGGGIAGLEALLALHDLAEDRAELTLVAPDPDFTYKPLVVEEPFSLKPAERHELAPLLSELGARFVQHAVTGVLADDHAVELADGSQIEYEILVVCMGGRARDPYQRAVTFRVGGRGTRHRCAACAQRRRRVEDARLRRAAWSDLAAADLRIGADESSPGRGNRTRRGPHVGDHARSGSTDHVRPHRKRGRRRAASDPPYRCRARDLRLRERGGRAVVDARRGGVDAGAIVALPLIEGPGLVGLPVDDHGFIPIDEHARVPGVEDVYAAGDGTTFPIKQGGLGTQQADAAAEHIAARLGAPVEAKPFHPVLRGQLITGAESLHLRHDLTGGHGEGTASADYLWWPPHKVSGRYLAAWLAHEMPRADPEPPGGLLDIEVPLSHEWHEKPMALDPYGPLGVD